MSPLRRALMKLAEVATRRPGRTLLVALFVGLAALPGASTTSVTGDLDAMLPDRPGPARGLALWLQGFAANESVFGLVESETSDPARLAAIGEELVTALEASENVVSAAIRPADGLPAADPLLTLELLDEAGLRALAERTSPEALERRAEGLRNLLMSPMDQETRSLLLRDPLGLLETLGARLGSGVQRFDAAGGGFLSPDGRALLMIVKPVKVDGPARAFSAVLEADLHDRADAVLSAHDGVTFGVTGGLMYARHIEDATRADGARLAIVSIIAVLLLYLVFYRSIHSLGTMLLLLPFSALVTLGLPGKLLGELTPMAAGFAAILFGLGIDPAVHLTSRYREARVVEGAQAAALEAVRTVGPPVVTASTTTAFALLGMSVVGSEGMAQMGALAALGVLVNAVVMLTVLPALWMVLGDRIPPDVGVGRGLAEAVARALHRRHTWVMAGFGVLALGLLVFRAPLTYSVDMDGFRPGSLEPVRVDRAIDTHFGEDMGRMVVLLRGTDREAVLQANDAWAEVLDGAVEDGTLRAVESLAVLEPSASTARARRARAVEVLKPSRLAEDLEAALVSAGFRTEPFAEALEGLRGYSADTNASEAAAPWRKWFAEKHVASVDGEVRVVSHLHRLPEPNPKVLYDTLNASAPLPTEGVEAYVTGLPLVEFQVEKYLEWGMPRILLSGSAILLLVLVVHYRRRDVVALAVVPLAGGLFCFVGVYAATGAPITFFALAGIPLLIGVGIDDHLFMLDRYLERDGRPGRLDETLAGAGRAIVLTTLTTLAAFGVLSLSTFEALAGMGKAVSLALAIAFAASVLLLPALLARFLPGLDAPAAHDSAGDL